MRPLSAPEERLYRGTVRRYIDSEGQGLIDPDLNQDITSTLLFSRESFADSGLSFAEGDRVVFGVTQSLRGPVVVGLKSEVAQNPDAGNSEIGRVATFSAEGGHGSISLPDGGEAFFHFSELDGVTPSELRKGLPVSFRAVAEKQGLQAKTIQALEKNAIPTVREPPNAPETTPSRGAPSLEGKDYLAKAILAREGRRLDEAARLYEQGMQAGASMQLVLSYAAMEKMRNRMPAAMAIYQRGIKLFPRSAKLHEDAAIVARALGEYDRAVKLLNRSLVLCREENQRGEKGVLVALARTLYEIGTQSALKEALEHYQQAESLFRASGKRIDQDTILKMNLAAVRTIHHRGDVAVSFFHRAGLPFVRATLLDAQQAEFVLAVATAEFKESYGLGGHLVVRCMFKPQVTLKDLEAHDRAVNRWANAGLADDQIALLVVSSLPNDLLRLLSKRIEERKGSEIAIVPVQQTEMETSREPLATLRNILDRWLHRRDLFASGTSYVQGRRFFGRAKALGEIRDAISSGTPTGIFGLRKVGKTSLLKESQRRSTETGDIVVYVDLLSLPADVNDCRWLYWHIGDELRRQAENRPYLHGFEWTLGGRFRDILAVPENFPIATAFDSDLRRLLSALSAADVSPQPRVVLMLDEIERVLPIELGKPGFEGFFDFFSYWRGISQQYDTFVYLVTAANPAISEMPQFNGRDNPVFNGVREAYLDMLEPVECEMMVRELGRGMGLQFTTNAQRLIYTLTGGHPFITRRLCSYVASRYRERPIRFDATQIQSVIDDYLDERGDDFREILDRLKRDYPSEFELCIKLAQAGGLLPVNELRKRLGVTETPPTKHLVGYRIARLDGANLGLAIDLMTRWLRLHYPAHAA